MIGESLDPQQVKIRIKRRLGIKTKLLGLQGRTSDQRDPAHDLLNQSLGRGQSRHHGHALAQGPDLRLAPIIVPEVDQETTLQSHADVLALDPVPVPTVVILQKNLINQGQFKLSLV